jgi:hypothetical protein
MKYMGEFKLKNRLNLPLVYNDVPNLAEMVISWG